MSKTLVIGGLNGLVGSNTTEALVSQGRDCVATMHQNREIPGFLQPHIDHERVIIEQADATSLDDLRKIGEKHQIDSIVNVGGGFRSPGTKGPITGLKGYFDMLDAAFRVAEEWKIKRLTFSSTGGVYMGLPGLSSEDLPLPIASRSPIIAYQKIVEVAASEFVKATGISSICVRLTGMFGPGQDPTYVGLPARLVHAAARGKPPSFEGARFALADDETALCYIKDMARAIAMLHTADKLSHEVYNVGSPKLTPNRELVDAVKSAVPDFNVTLPPGRSPPPPPTVMETKRLQADTGYTPKFTIESAVQDYVGWLRAGNPK